MNETQVHSFMEAARTLSFTDAAACLHLSQQAVSRYVINLEKELGAALFRREPKRLSLTAAGRYYYSYFCSARLDFLRVGDGVKRAYDGLTKRFRIGYSQWIDPLGAIDKGILKFRQRHPNTKFSGRQYDNDRLFEELREGSLDAAILSEAQASWIKEFEKAPVADEDICIYAPSYVEGDRPDAGLWGLPVLLNASWEWTYFEWRQILIKELNDLAIESERIIILPNMQSVFAELAIGDCIIVSDHRFGHARSYKNMRRFPVDSRSRLVCLWRSENENPLVGEFIDTMRETYGYKE